MITVKYKPNRFENTGIKIRSLKYDRSRTIKDYIIKARFKESKKDLLNYDVIISGKIEKNLEKIILDRSSFEIIFTPKVLDEDWVPNEINNNVGRILLLLLYRIKIYPMNLKIHLLELLPEV
jgi:hypothetical protein